MSHSLMSQLKAQLLHDRAIAGDDEINALPDSGNVDAFARRLVSAAEPTNLSLVARDGRFGSADGIVSVVSDEADEFGGNDNNRRVAERIAREAEMATCAATSKAEKRAAARAAPAGDVIGIQREMDAAANPDNAAVDLTEVGTIAHVVGFASEGNPDQGQPMMGGQTFAAPAGKQGKPKTVPAWKPQG